MRWTIICVVRVSVTALSVWWGDMCRMRWAIICVVRVSVTALSVWWGDMCRMRWTIICVVRVSVTALSVWWGDMCRMRWAIICVVRVSVSALSVCGPRLSHSIVRVWSASQSQHCPWEQMKHGENVRTHVFYRAMLRRTRYCYGKLSVRPSVCLSVKLTDDKRSVVFRRHSPFRYVRRIILQFLRLSDVNDS